VVRVEEKIDQSNKIKRYEDIRINPRASIEKVIDIF